MGKKKILLVEDNETDEAMVRRALEVAKIDVEIEVARDGAAALLALERPGAVLPALVILDIKLPKVTGHEVLYAIRNHQSTLYVPVVILSSSAEDLDIRAAYEAGCSGYVQKPVDAEEFIEAVGALGRYWVCVNRGPE
ncbi:MAG: response regulator [Deltaproteobacteria bacterium]|nr:response regulator [Deltaproteobacteria bacterium]